MSVWQPTQRFPSRPNTKYAMGDPDASGGNSVTCPARVILARLSWLCSMNQRLPSGPHWVLLGRLLGVGSANSLIVYDGTVRSSNRSSTNRRLAGGSAAWRRRREPWVRSDRDDTERSEEADRMGKD